MSKILVVEPQRMLQQAIVLSLFPEHEVQLTESLPESGTVKDYDLVIVDVAALREKDLFSAQSARNVQNWKVPTIWLEGVDVPDSPSREKRVVLNRPIAKDAWLSALAQCLELPGATKLNGPAKSQQMEPGGAAKATSRGNKTTGTADEDEGQYIELVDVVEEPPRPNSKRPPSRKKK